MCALCHFVDYVIWKCSDEKNTRTTRTNSGNGESTCSIFNESLSSFVFQSVLCVRSKCHRFLLPFFHYCNRNNHIVRMQECPRFRVVTTTHTQTSLLTFASHMNLRFKWIRTIWTTEDLQPMQFTMQNATRFTVFSIGVCVFSGINKLYHVFLCFCRINNRFTPPNNLLPLPTTAFQSDSH